MLCRGGKGKKSVLSTQKDRLCLPPRPAGEGAGGEEKNESPVSENRLCRFDWGMKKGLSVEAVSQ